MHNPEAKEKYLDLCKKEASIPVFCRDWWLDIVCGRDNWNVILAEKGSNIVGAMPYYVTRGPFGSSRIIMPKLTRHLGVWIRYQNNQDTIRRLSFEKEVMYSIIEKLESTNIAFFSQHFHYSFTNWLPFLWKGFQQTTRYTYVLEDLTDLDGIFRNFERDKRTWIRKGEDNLKTGYDISAEEFHRVHRQALARQGLAINYSQEMLEEIFRAAYALEQGKSIFCRDAQGRTLGCLFIIWDECTANFLISAYDPEYRKNGMGALLTWEAIKYAATKTRKCDFTGSIIETYERSYPSFGGVQKPYFNIQKTYSPLYMIRDGFRQLNDGLKIGLKKIAFTRNGHGNKSSGNPQDRSVEKVHSLTHR